MGFYIEQTSPSPHKNKSVSGVKRRRSTFSSYSDDISDASIAPKHKKRKKDHHNDEDDEDEDYDEDEDLDEMELDEGEYLIEKITGHRLVGDGKYKYNIKWVGYTDCTWEPKENLNDEVIDDYWNGNGGKHDKEGAMAHFIATCTNKKQKNKSSKKKKKKKDKKKKKRSQKRNRKMMTIMMIRMRVRVL